MPETFAEALSPQASRLWRYAPLVGWMVFIFFASSAQLSAANTSKVLRPLLLWFYPSIGEETIELVHFMIRKAAHFTEYAIFALLAARAFLESSREFLRSYWLLAALGLVAFYSLTDEFHQSFVPSRTASVYDSMIDTAGGFVALISFALMRSWHNRLAHAASR